MSDTKLQTMEKAVSARTSFLSGSIMVEACMVVPIFFLVMVPFLYLMRMTLCTAMMENALQGALEQLAVESYVLMVSNGTEEGDSAEDATSAVAAETDTIVSDPALAAHREELSDLQMEMRSYLASENGSEDLMLDLLGTLYLRGKIQHLLQEEDLGSWGIEGGWSGISLLGSRFFFSESGQDQLMQAALTIHWEQSFAFWSPEDTVIYRTTRAFGGTDLLRAEGTSGETSASSEDETVYRMGQGVHYHQADCFLISKDILTLSAEEAISLGLRACERCRPSKISTGLVYMTSGGDRFHTASCDYLFPELTALTKEQAERMGLSPCGLCYGGENYFR